MTNVSPEILRTAWERYPHGPLAELWYTPEGVGLFHWVHTVSCVVAVSQEGLRKVKSGTAAALGRIKVDLDRILQIQREGENHQLRAYLKMVQEKMKENGDEEFLPFVHQDLTSFDLQDTATALMLSESAILLSLDLKELAEVIRNLAKEHKYTFMIGRTHGIHAKPITFGKKCLDWLDIVERSIESLAEAEKKIRVGKISGAVGIFTQDPRIEEETCDALDLEPARVSTQIIARDRHASFFHEIVLTVCRLEVISTAIRLGQQTERQELEESFASTGSSAMPHKRNAEKCEQIKAAAKVVRNCMGALYEDVDTWDERSLDQSATERLLFGSMLVVTGYCVRSMIEILSGLTVNVERMKANIGITNGAIFAEDVKTALQQKGVPQNEAYELVKGPARKAYKGEGTLVDNCLSVAEIAAHLSREDLEQICNPESALRYLDTIYARFGI